VSLEKTLPRVTNSNALTLREQECVYYLTKGFTFREMANALNISPRTVETHVTNIKLKLKVNTRAELIVKVCELGYIQINPRNPDWKPGKLQLLSIKPCESVEEIL
jgi:DNA-binding NarL/FixJ family response regulator